MPWRSTSKLIANTLRFVSVVLASATHPRALEVKAAIGDAVLVYVLSLPLLLLLLLLPLALPLVMPLLLLLSLPDEGSSGVAQGGIRGAKQAGLRPGRRAAPGEGGLRGSSEKKLPLTLLGDR
jgi:hypothetical protein